VKHAKLSGLTASLTTPPILLVLAIDKWHEIINNEWVLSHPFCGYTNALGWLLHFDE
jgi:hypothetical protein